MPFIYILGTWFILNIFLIGLQEEKQSTLIMYQKSSYALQKFDIMINDEKLDVNFGNKTSLELKVSSGKLKIVTKGTRFLAETNEYVIDIAENETYFLEAYVDYEYIVVNLKIKVSSSKEYNKVAQKLKKIVLDEPIQTKQ